MNEYDIFTKALDIDDEDGRRSYLDQVCGDDSSLRQRVDILLASHQQVGSLLEHPAAEGLGTELFSGAEPSEGGADTKTMPQLGGTSLDFLQASDDPKSLGQLGQYEILEVIGRGGMGVVLRAHDTRLNRIVAVKVLAPELASNATARQRFSREAQSAAAISHDHVVAVIAVEEDAEQTHLPYLVMEFIDGVSLQQKIDSGGPLELKEILRIAHQVAAGLSAAHLQGLIHRDVKPSNILLQNGVQRVKITDFGLARAVDDVGITRTGEVAGTPQYMSPEQALGHSVDPRSDLFSLGSVLYAMCTGRGPFRADSTVASLRRVCDDTPRPIREINPDIPVWLVDIIDSLLQKKPADRFQSAEEVSDLLAKCLSRLQEVGPSSMPGIVIPHRKQPAKKPDSRHSQPRGTWLVPVMILLVVGTLFSVTEATGVTDVSNTVIRLMTGEGTLVIEIDDPSVEVSLDGEELSITGAGLQELKLRPGQYQFKATKDGQPIEQKLVSISRGGREVVRVSLESVTTGPDDRKTVSGVSETDYKSTPDRAITLLRTLDRTGLEGGNFWHRTISDLEFAPTGELLCGRGGAGVVEVWNINSGTWYDVFAAGGHIAVSPKGDLVATAAYNERITFWSLKDLRQIQHWKTPQSAICQVAYSPDQRYLVTKSRTQDMTARVWDVETGAEIHCFESGCPSPIATFSPNGQALLLGTAFDTGEGLVLYDLESDEEIWRVPGGFSVAEFSPDGRWIISNYPDCSLRMLDAETGEEVRRFVGHTDWAYSLQFLPDGRHFVSGSRGDRTMRLWNIETSLELARIEAEKHFLNRLAVSPDGRHVASGGGVYKTDDGEYKGDGDYAIRIWVLPKSVWPEQTPAVESSPFVVLSGNKAEVARFNTLADAVLGSRTGDTIVIRGNGPFMMEPLRIDHSLAIRASEGFEPVIRCNLDAELSRENPLIDQYAPLVLEGIHIEVSDSANDADLSCAIVARAPLKIANCQITAANEGFGVWSQSDCEFVNSLFMARADAVTLLDNDGQRQTAALRNCLVTSIDIASIGHRQIDLALESNTVCNDRWLLKVWPVRKSAKAFDDTHRTDKLRIRGGDNVFEVGAALLDIQVPEELKGSFKVDSAISWLHDTVDRQDARSLLAGSGPLVRVSRPVETGEFEWIEVLSRLTEWNAIWDQDHAISEVSVVRFQGGDLKARIAHDMARLTPEDFRLRPDSAGYQAGPDGQDLGANIDFVGPGEAYERWKKTAEYQQWLRDARELTRPESTEIADTKTSE